jgi:hypothetical protein
MITITINSTDSSAYEAVAYVTDYLKSKGLTTTVSPPAPVRLFKPTLPNTSVEVQGSNVTLVVNGTRFPLNMTTDQWLTGFGSCYQEVT